MGFPDSSVGKESTCSVGDLGSIPGLGRSPGEGKGYPLQYSGLENSMDSPWSPKELDTAERISLSLSYGYTLFPWACTLKWSLVLGVCHVVCRGAEGLLRVAVLYWPVTRGKV